MKWYILIVGDKGYNLGKRRDHEEAKAEALRVLRNWHEWHAVNNWAYEGDGLFMNYSDHQTARLATQLIDD